MLTSIPVTPASVGLFLLALTCILYALYLRVLPRPIPGIPYNKAAAKSIWGDAPALMSYNKQTNEVWRWVTDQFEVHQSPIFQIFIRPFSKPWVIISDFQESQDILMRRGKEFDRSVFFGDVFVGTIPDHHIVKKTHDPSFKGNKALMKDLMTPGFLHDVFAPSMYTTISALIEFWHKKMLLAQGHPFRADEDMNRAALDAIFATTFPMDAEDGNTSSQMRLLKTLPSIDLPSDPDAPAEYPETELPPTMQSILTITDAIEVSIKAPIPRLAHTVIRQFPWFRRAHKVKEDFLEAQIRDGVKRFQGHEETYKQVCALDEILRREHGLAEKEARSPNYTSRVIKDELMGFLIGGHDTTSTYLTWALKLIADNARAQTKLRKHLRERLPSAAKERRNPTSDEISKTSLPYLDAVIEEVMRLGGGVSGIGRTAMEDAVVLGHIIPKGTDLFMWVAGPGYKSPMAPQYEIDDKLRSESSLSQKGRQVGRWEDHNIAEFVPERWLVEDEKGHTVFDNNAGPMLSFGLGARGCFGRRLAYVEMRLMIALIVWNFEMLRCGEGLSSYKATDKMLSKPDFCYVKLKEAEW